MRNSLGVIAIMLAASGAPAFAFNKDCFPTVADAVQGLMGPEKEIDSQAGYRVANVRLDTLHRRAWAMVERCGKPEVPWIAIAIRSDSKWLSGPDRRGEPVVHIGDAVSIEARNGLSQMEVHGWAEESGAVAANIRVRLPRLSADAGEPMPKIMCVVTSAGHVEVVQ